jgi:tetratricopeptide (TPR) repeat protein
MNTSGDGLKKKRLGDFEIVRELGRGGMGIVYEARQISLNRKVALKVLSSGLGMTTKAVIRFRREAETAAKLHHTNIVPVHATGEEDGTHFYAMELVDGPSLNFVIRNMRDQSRSVQSETHAQQTPPRVSDSTVAITPKPVTPDASLEDTGGALPDWVAQTMNMEAGTDSSASGTSAGESSSTISAGHTFFDNIAGMMADVADALGYAHSQDVVHRDMKPSNLLLSPDGRVSINDFGLARMLEQPGMTTTGEFMGSPLYMSPEQITAGRAPLDHRTDIYSLGATLYELLTLQPPFLGERRDQIIGQIMHKEPRSPRSVNKKIPVDLETICLKAMEKDPDRRYQTGEDMAEDLRRFVNRFAISAKRAGLVGRATKLIRRHRALSATVCFAFVVTVAATFFAYSGWVEKQTHIREQAMDRALTAAMSGDLAEATEQITQAETHGATAAWVLMLAGQVDLFRGKTEDAVENLLAAVEQDPDSVAAQSMLAYAYLTDGEYTEYTRRVATLDTLTPVTTEDYLFQGRAIGLFSPEQGIASMNKAIERRPSSHLARVMRAWLRVFQALDQENESIVLQALEELRATKTYLGDNLFLSGTTLYAQLAAVTLFRAGGKTELAQAHLLAAATEVERLEKHPHFLLGHFFRVYYHVFTADLDAVERVTREAINQGQTGFVLSPYTRAMFDAGRVDEALKELERIPDQSGVTLKQDRAYLLLETPSGRAQAEIICHNLLEQNLQNDMMPAPSSLLFLLGKPDEARETARNYLTSIQVSKYWEFPRDMLRYLGGLINEKEYLEMAGNSARDRGVAHFHIGVRRLAAGDRTGALEHFEKSAATTVFHWGSVHRSKVWAARMKRDPEWPNWLPVRDDDGATTKSEPATAKGSGE